MEAITDLKITVNPVEVITTDNRSIFIWLDLLGFSDFVNDGTKYIELADHLRKFQSSFLNSGSYTADIISDGIILRITKKNLALRGELSSIFKEIAQKQFEFTQETKVFIRGGISVGTKLDDDKEPNSLYISNGLAKAVKIEGKYVSWPIIGTTPDELNEIRSFLDVEGNENFGLEKAFNKDGKDLFFIDFIGKSDGYYALLNAKMEKHKEKSYIRNKYLWLLRYYHLKYAPDYTLDAVFEKVVL